MHRFQIRRRSFVLGTVLLCAALSPLRAQTAEDAATSVQRTLVTPSASAPIQSSVPVFFLAGNADKSEAHIQGGFRVTDDPMFGRLYATLGLTTPLSSDEDEPSVFGDLSGLTGGTTLSLAITGQRWRWTSTAAQNTEWCKQQVQSGRVTRVKIADCEDFDLTEVVGDDRALERAFYRERSTSQPLLYEVSARYQPEEMKYLDATTFLPASLDRGSGSVGVSVGRFFANQLLSVGYRYQVAYAQGSSAEICLPEGTGGALRCRKAPLGKPVRKESSVGSVQTRGYFGRNLAWNPHFTYRFADQEWGVEVPLYFVPGESGLMGGVTPGYNSVDHKWTFTVFFGKAFRVGL
jgi:hypothetical protein